MKIDPSDFVGVHTDPIWRYRANFIFHTLLALEDNKQEWEQLWGERLPDGNIVLCCIPFFSYGLALGDILELNSFNVVERIAKKGGHKTFRIWFEEQELDFRKSVLQELAKLDLFLEWSSRNLLAISSPTAASGENLEKFLKPKHGKGLIYERG